ncbi:MAG: phosphoribosyltransferase [Rhodobacteraceae bacterium]|nr:phosphoribosyltransferase [Paracoccaceae bacterium]
MFIDRADAGRQLADRLAALGLPSPVVLALPRGGVPVAAEIAARLGAPLDLILVRKIGAPGHAEYAAGAVVDGDPPETVWNDDALRMLRLTPADFTAAVQAEVARNAQRRALYQGGRAPLPLAGRTAIVVDDGIATGATMKAALRGLAHRGPARVVLAVPVAPPDVVEDLRALADDVVCLRIPADFGAVGEYYRSFPQVSDAEVQAILARA